MDKKRKYFSDMEKYEIININDGDKYSYLGHNDVIIDEDGNLKKIMLGGADGKISLFANKVPTVEIPWDKVKKIGSKTIIIDFEGELEK